MFKTFLGNLERGCHKLVAVHDGFLEEFLVECHYHQSVLRLIFGVEQTDIDEVVAQLKVVMQHTIVEEQLHIVWLQLVTVVARVGLVGLDVQVAPRFLLHQELQKPVLL